MKILIIVLTGITFYIKNFDLYGKNYYNIVSILKLK